ncbi:MAG: DUF4838 domain-containing protein [Planctomycetota bacterium]
MSKIFFAIPFALAFLVATASRWASAEHTLVKEGSANCVIIMPSSPSPQQRFAIDDFLRTLKKASGAEIPTVTPERVTEVPASHVKILIDQKLAHQTLGVLKHDLQDEEFFIRSRGDSIIIAARDLTNRHDDKQSLVTTWALSYLLDRHLGVRWLWPGDLGTVIPQAKTISVPKLNVRWQPKLVRRSFNINLIPKAKTGDDDALRLWAAHHQAAGERVNYRFAHSFRKGSMNGDWFGRFHEAKPEMLARGPDGKVGYPKGKPDRVKICISNPDVTDEILRLWRTAGRPDFWDVTPNDGNCFCCCDDCRALDEKFGGVTYTKDEVWRRPPHVNLTDRYVWFWNGLIRKMRVENAKAKIGVYFYSAYRDPPTQLRLEPGIIGEIVHGFDFELWKSWQAAGASEIGLRPNWWHMGANAPHLPLRTVGAYIEKARDSGMRWIAMDTLVEYWATQGAYYYLVARLIARPDLTTKDIIDEYCDSFKESSNAIREYLHFWESYHRTVAYNIPAGGSLSQDAKGLYEKVSRERFGSVVHPLRGHWQTLPWIYPPEVLDQANLKLTLARNLAGDEVTRRRIDFLIDGLGQLERTIAIVKTPKNDRGKLIKPFKQATRVNQQKHGYWGLDGLWIMSHWGVFGKEVNLEGM